MSNLKSFLMFSTVFSVVVGLSVSGADAKTIWLDENQFQIAQGDGDYQPTNFSLTEEEVSLQANAMKMADSKEKKETVDDKKLPTLTSEGSFLLPTYILPEAKDQAPKTVASVDEQNPWRKQPASTQIATPSAQKGIALKGIETPAPQAKSSLQDKQLLANIEKQYQDTNALLESTAKRLAALENGIENLAKKTPEVPAVKAPSPTSIVPKATFKVEDAKVASATNEEVQDNCITVSKSAPRAPLLLPLAPIRAVATSEAPKTEEQETAQNTAPAKKEYVDYILEVIARNASKQARYSASDEMVLRSIPKEMKISFLPDSADLSAQAFKWIKVFSYNPQRSVISAVEVRLSPDNLDLQSRRFALIKGALLANGVAPRQIRFVFTDRDADTVVLRNIELPPEEELLFKKGKNGKVSQQIIQKW